MIIINIGLRSSQPCPLHRPGVHQQVSTSMQTPPLAHGGSHSAVKINPTVQLVISSYEAVHPLIDSLTYCMHCQAQNMVVNVNTVVPHADRKSILLRIILFFSGSSIPVINLISACYS